jgi:hypothetical protein
MMHTAIDSSVSFTHIEATEIGWRDNPAEPETNRQE